MNDIDLYANDSCIVQQATTKFKFKPLREIAHPPSFANASPSKTPCAMEKKKSQLKPNDHTVLRTAASSTATWNQQPTQTSLLRAFSPLPEPTNFPPP